MPSPACRHRPPRVPLSCTALPCPPSGPLPSFPPHPPLLVASYPLPAESPPLPPLPPPPYQLPLSYPPSPPRPALPSSCVRRLCPALLLSPPRPQQPPALPHFIASLLDLGPPPALPPLPVSCSCLVLTTSSPAASFQVTTLVLSHNPFSNDAGVALEDMLRRNTSITAFEANHTHLSQPYSWTHRPMGPPPCQNSNILTQLLQRNQSLVPPDPIDVKALMLDKRTELKVLFYSIASADGTVQQPELEQVLVEFAASPDLSTASILPQHLVDILKPARMFELAGKSSLTFSEFIWGIKVGKGCDQPLPLPPLPDPPRLPSPLGILPPAQTGSFHFTPISFLFPEFIAWLPAHHVLAQREDTVSKVVWVLFHRRQDLKVLFYQLAGKSSKASLQQIMDGLENCLKDHGWSITFEEASDVLTPSLYARHDAVLAASHDQLLTWPEFINPILGLAK